MEKRNSPVSVKLKVSSAFMLVTLLWLTLSIPFVYDAQQEFAKEKIASSSHHAATDDESSDSPVTNTNEEKCTGSFSTLSEEYLHHHLEEDFNFSCRNIIDYHHGHEDTYIAFHGELLCPPPNA